MRWCPDERIARILLVALPARRMAIGVGPPPLRLLLRRLVLPARRVALGAGPPPLRRLLRRLVFPLNPFPLGVGLLPFLLLRCRAACAALPLPLGAGLLPRGLGLPPNLLLRRPSSNSLSATRLDVPLFENPSRDHFFCEIESQTGPPDRDNTNLGVEASNP